MIYLAAFLFTAVVVGGLAWFVCECLESALDLEDLQ